MTSNEHDSAPTSADAGPTDDTAVVPDCAPTGAAPELAWSQDDDTEELARQPWPVAWATAAVLVLSAAILVAAAGIAGWAIRPSARPRTPAPAQPTTVIVQAAPSTSTVTAQAAPPPTVTIQAPPPAPKTTTVQAVPEPSSEAVAAPLSESVYDPFLDRMASLGYTVSNRSLALSSAHEVCRLLRLGEPPAQVNRQMQAQTGSSPTDVLQLTSSVILAYPDCFAHGHNDGD